MTTFGVIYYTFTAIFWGSVLGFFWKKKEMVEVLISFLFSFAISLAINAIMNDAKSIQPPIWLFILEGLLSILILHGRATLHATDKANKASMLLLVTIIFSFAFFYASKTEEVFPAPIEEKSLEKIGAFMLNLILMVAIGTHLLTHKSVNYGTNADDRCPTGHEERRTNSIACGAGGNAPDGP